MKNQVFNNLLHNQRNKMQYRVTEPYTQYHTIVFEANSESFQSSCGSYLA